MDIHALPSVPVSRRDLLPDAPGLYFLLLNGDVIYVGISTTSLRVRWASHGKRTVDDSATIAFETAISPDELHTAEVAAIAAFRPRLNVAFMKQQAVKTAIIDGDRLVSLAVAAEELKIGHERLRQLAKSEQISAVRRGKLWYLRESEIARLKERGRLKPGPRRPRAE